MISIAFLLLFPCVNVADSSQRYSSFRFPVTVALALPPLCVQTMGAVEDVSLQTCSGTVCRISA